MNMGCPWASRANLVRSLKGLEDVIQMVVLDWELYPEGWYANLPIFFLHYPTHSPSIYHYTGPLITLFHYSNTGPSQVEMALILSTPSSDFSDFRNSISEPSPIIRDATQSRSSGTKSMTLLFPTNPLK